jgi:hypothetical protein
MKKEHVAIAIIGAFLLTYLLDAVADPLTIPLAHPYQYLNNQNFSTYPFTTASILIRSLAIIAIPFLFFGFVPVSPAAKGGFFLLLSVLMQLYSVQRIATGSNIIPLEWAISLAFAGAVLTLFGIYYLIIGAMVHTHKKLKKNTKDFATYTGETEAENPDAAPDWLEKDK